MNNPAYVKLTALIIAITKIAPELSEKILDKIPLLIISRRSWLRVIHVLKIYGCRCAGMWGTELTDAFQVDAIFYFNQQYFLLRTDLDKQVPRLASASSYYPSISRLERHMRDLLGIDFFDANDKRRWVRHQAWTRRQFPLRMDYPNPSVALTPSDDDYPFQDLRGIGVCEVPVGPIHAGIIEPGHFRFKVAGEDILQMEERLGYLHKGIEKIAVGRDFSELIKLAGRVSGDSTVAYAWATCQAIENSYYIELSPRANYLRAILAERERIANHLWDIAAIVNDVGFSFGYYQLGRLREEWLRMNELIYGHRLLMDNLVVGGVASDLTASTLEKLRIQIAQTRIEFLELNQILKQNSSLQNRLRTTGILTKEHAEHLGTLGYVAKASGIDFDVRRHFPYFPYDALSLKPETNKYGDVAARLSIRTEEILESCELLEHLLGNLPDGTYQTKFDSSWNRSGEGIGIVEGWRGEIIVYVAFDKQGKVTRYFPRDPSWFNWLALECLLDQNIIPDFPVCNKSINGSYAGVDL